MSIVKMTTLNFWKSCIKKRWTYSSKRKPGRPPVAKEIRELILRIKGLNYSWGNLRISDELGKIGHNVSKDTTVRRVIQKGRKEGEILPNGSWNHFLRSHWNSLFACDFLTVDTVFNSRLYVFFIIEFKSRKIVQYQVTSNPTMRFVKNQLLGFMYGREEQKTCLIHDNSGELRWLDYESLGIKGISTTPYSPNMNSYAERFVRSVRNECLDHFVVFNRRQLVNLLREYVKYYNSARPHQGISGRLPDGSRYSGEGQIIEKKVLFGLYTSFSREAA